MRKSRLRKHVRRSVTLPADLARQVDSIAHRRRLPHQRVLLELIENGMEARKKAEREFFDLAQRFRDAPDPEQARKLGDQLGKFVFGE